MVGHQRTTRHSLLHAIKELRGHKVANDHDKGNITRLRTDCNLVLFSWPSGTADCDQAVKATCAWIWQFLLGGILCTDKRMVLASAAGLRLSGPRARDD